MSWVKKIMSKYEWRNNKGDDALPPQTSTGSVVQMRKKFYESYMDKNKSIDKNEQSNIEKSPSKVVNEDNLCIYVDSTENSVFGSFRKRPKFHRWPNLKGSENDIMMRIKEVESEFQSIQRYESMLRPPLFQQVIVSKHQSEIEGIADEKTRKPSMVATMVDVFNQQAVNKNSQEKSIDLDLINSLKVPRKTALSSGKSTKIFPEFQINRNILWVEMKQVLVKNVTLTMSKEKIKFMESQFELISSEASYNRSLAVLVDKFYNSPKLSLTASMDSHPVIKPHQKEHLFSNILKIYSVSSKFLADMERGFCEDIYMPDICDTISRYAEREFDVYVPYIQNQRFQTDAYNALKKNQNAAKVIEELESQPECCSLNLDSFLLLPMQRLLRILMLLKNIRNCAYANRKFIHDSVTKAIGHMEKIVKKCNDNKIHIDERQRMLEICSHLEFRNGRRKVNISIGRLILEGEVKRGPKNSPRNILPDFLYFKDFWFILTSEYLLMTKTTKCKEMSYVVEDYYNSSKILVKTDSRENDESFLEFKLCIKKSHNFDTFIVLTKSRQDWKRWRDSLAESLSETQ